MENKITNDVQEQVGWVRHAGEAGWSFITAHALDFLMAVVILTVGIYIARILRRMIRRLMRHPAADQLVIDFVSQGVYLFTLMIVGIAALNKLGVPTDSFVVALGGLGLGVGIALKDNISNLAAGILLLVFRPFRVGDFITINETADGTVMRITLMNVHLKTLGQQAVIVPNSMAVTSVVRNYSTYPTRSMELLIDVGYESDLDEVIAVLKKCVHDVGGVLNQKTMVIGVREFAENSIRIYLRPEVRAQEYWNIYHDLMKLIKNNFDAAGISIPFPQRVLHLENAAAAPPLSGQPQNDTGR